MLHKKNLSNLKNIMANKFNPTSLKLGTYIYIQASKIKVAWFLDHLRSLLWKLQVLNTSEPKARYY